ncbi:hypothetical protein [Streptomyces sp. NPDC048527]
MLATVLAYMGIHDQQRGLGRRSGRLGHRVGGRGTTAARPPTYTA